MADIAENLRSVIVNSTAILAVMPTAAEPHAVEQSGNPESPDHPRIWYGRSGANEELDLSGTGGLTQQTFDLEVISDDLDQAQDIAAAVKKYLNGKRGTFGSGTVQGVFVNDQSDDYLPRGISDESGLAVAAINITIWHDST